MDRFWNRVRDKLSQPSQFSTGTVITVELKRSRRLWESSTRVGVEQEGGRLGLGGVEGGRCADCAHRKRVSAVAKLCGFRVVF